MSIFIAPVAQFPSLGEHRFQVVHQHIRDVPGLGHALQELELSSRSRSSITYDTSCASRGSVSIAAGGAGDRWVALLGAPNFTREAGKPAVYNRPWFSTTTLWERDDGKYSRRLSLWKR